VEDEMSVTIRFLGTAAFEIITENRKRLLIDPYLDENHASPYKVADIDRLDLLLVTHAAYDHLGDTLKIMRKFPDLPLVCGADVRGYLLHHGIASERLMATPWSMQIRAAGVVVRPVESRHWSYIQSEDGQSFSSIPLGFIIDAGEDVRVYHSGDTAVFSDMKLLGELYQPTIGLLNVGVPEDHRGAQHGVAEYLTGEMDAVEAAMACKFLNLKYAIPCHHDNPKLPQIVKFNELLLVARGKNPDATTPLILAPGEAITIGPSGVEKI
jgi:L-ascorbate metabolism protein UlaG (beta-lactamase superfamily)